MNTRRGILQLLGVAPAAAGSVLPEIAKALALPQVRAVTKLGGENGQVNPAPNLSQDPIHALLQSLRRDFEIECNIKEEIRRTGRCDPDIDCLRSVSITRKMQMQYERQMEVQQTFRAIGKKLGWD